jgi:hypothetical protein
MREYGRVMREYGMERRPYRTKKSENETKDEILRREYGTERRRSTGYRTGWRRERKLQGKGRWNGKRVDGIEKW